jgi:cephalosporin-C deacetylase
VYAAFNNYGGKSKVEKRIVEYPFNDHEGGDSFHRAIQLEWLAALVR